MTRNDVTLDGRRLAVWTRPGTGVPLLVIHGGPDVASGYLRHHLPAALPEELPLVFVDLPGTGRSDRAPDVTVEGMATDLLALVKELGIDRLVPLAHSFGGLVALTLAMLMPERVPCVILVDPDPPKRASWEQAFTILDGRRSGDERARLASLEASGRWRSSVDALEDYLRVRLRAYAHDASALAGMVFDLPESCVARFGETGARVRQSSGQWDLRSALAQLRMPVLVLTGPSSPYPPESLEELRDSLLGATLEVVDATGHFPFMEAPGAFREAVGGFLSSVGEE